MVGSYTLNVFSGYKTWSDLKAYAVSIGLRVVDPKDSQYAIIRYDKMKSNFTNPLSAICRSVVIDKKTVRVVCLAPTRAKNLSDELLKRVWRAEPFVDGTMVNVFMDTDGNIGIATRSRIGGISSFDNKKSFAEQFADAVNIYGLTDLKTLFTGRSATFATFVMSHPHNRIVTPVTAPSLSLVQMGFVNADESVQIMEDPSLWTPTAQKFALVSCIPDLESVTAINAWTQKKGQEYGYGWQGVVLKDGLGNRMRVRSDQYQVVRKLRGNENTTYERFARLRHSRNIQQYIAFYPEDSETFYDLEGALRTKTKGMLTMYIDTFVSKKYEYQSLAWPYKYHVSVLHNLYKEKLRPAKKTVDQNEVIAYVNNLKVEDLANLLKPSSPAKVSSSAQAPQTPTDMEIDV